MKETYSPEEIVRLVAAALQMVGIPSMESLDRKVQAIVDSIVVVHSMLVMQAVGAKLGLEVETKMVTPEELADLQKSGAPGEFVRIGTPPQPAQPEDDFPAFMRGLMDRPN